MVLGKTCRLLNPTTKMMFCSKTRMLIFEETENKTGEGNCMRLCGKLLKLREKVCIYLCQLEIGKYWSLISDGF